MNAEPSPAELQQLAQELARDAGKVLLDFAQRSRSFVGTKSTIVDLVTDADTASEKFLVETLRERRPDDGIIGEEGTRDGSASGIHWVLDPLDGTTNFVYSLPFYSVSVGVVKDHVPVAGAVYNPVLDEMFAAHKGGGATLNGSTISVNQIDALETALLATGFSYDPQMRAKNASHLATMLPLVRDIRRCGSAALDLCNVACGRVDAYYEYTVKPWDITAGSVIAREAGATVTNVFGKEPDSSVLAAPAGIYNELLALLKKVNAELPEES